MPPPTPRRILAIDPGTRYLGFAVLDGAELLYYGVTDFSGKRPGRALLRATRTLLRRIIRTHRPTLLAYERSFFAPSRSSALLRAQEAEIERLGRAARLPVRSYSPVDVRQRLCRDRWATKETVADWLAARFPELGRYRVDGTWPSYWLHMFDALAVGVVCHDRLAQQHG